MKKGSEEREAKSEEKAVEKETKKIQKPSKNDLENLKTRLCEKEKTIEELTCLLKRVQAEFENYKKRCDLENKKYKDFAEARLIEKMLPILDSFESALNHKEQKDFAKGMELIYAQLVSLLEKEGLQKIKTVGERLDPFKHEVLMRCNDPEKDDDVVVEELQKGYTFKGGVIRTAKVSVNQK